MNLLVIGSGGREHALVYKLKQSPLCSEIFCIPGNGGIAEIATCVDMDPNDLPALCEFAQKHQIGLTVVGPEAPLVDGIVDLFESEGLKIFGPNKRCAAFEGSKLLTKQFLAKYEVPTAQYREAHSKEEALEALRAFCYPVVVKADGLAAGKGVIICETEQQATGAIEEMMVDKKFGAAGDTLVLEEFLNGTETSMLCFSDGNKLIPLASSKDYKKIFDTDVKLNEKINKKILDPI